MAVATIAAYRPSAEEADILRRVAQGLPAFDHVADLPVPAPEHCKSVWQYERARRKGYGTANPGRREALQRLKLNGLLRQYRAHSVSPLEVTPAGLAALAAATIKETA